MDVWRGSISCGRGYFPNFISCGTGSFAYAAVSWRRSLRARPKLAGEFARCPCKVTGILKRIDGIPLKDWFFTLRTQRLLRFTTLFVVILCNLSVLCASFGPARTRSTGPARADGPE